MSDVAMSSNSSNSSNLPPRRRAKPRRAARLGTTGAVALVVLLLIGFWQLAVSAGWINGKLLGSPTGIWLALRQGLDGGTLVGDTLVTFYETVLGLVIGSGLGIAAGLLLWFVPRVSGVAEGLSIILNSIPKIALGPLIVIWFGSDMASKVWLAGISTFAVAMISACAASREIDRDLLNLFRSFNARPALIFTKLILPGALPWVFSTLRVNIGFALIGAVVGEYIASQAGLGHEVFVAGSLFDLNTVWLGIIVLTLMATLLSWIVQFTEAKVISWKAR
ncbi:ABC transporter permease [Burkholderia plantarii]|uniref:ABC transporter permease n=1 Tax=Burkholderia plantarii TaxID=41899 RepID=UPI0006D8ABD4|nr:ABC transporter permease [Burkholderia plantarii]ALK33861.1 binding-protein-dependent transport system inner membrane protein [Burkholderia plantarii]